MVNRILYCVNDLAFLNEFDLQRLLKFVFIFFFFKFHLIYKLVYLHILKPFMLKTVIIFNVIEIASFWSSIFRSAILLFISTSMLILSSSYNSLSVSLSLFCYWTFQLRYLWRIRTIGQFPLSLKYVNFSSWKCRYCRQSTNY